MRPRLREPAPRSTPGRRRPCARAAGDRWEWHACPPRARPRRRRLALRGLDGLACGARRWREIGIVAAIAASAAASVAGDSVRRRVLAAGKPPRGVCEDRPGRFISF